MKSNFTTTNKWPSKTFKGKRISHIFFVLPYSVLLHIITKWVMYIATFVLDKCQLCTSIERKTKKDSITFSVGSTALVGRRTFKLFSVLSRPESCLWRCKHDSVLYFLFCNKFFRSMTKMHLRIGFLKHLEAKLSY